MIRERRTYVMDDHATARHCYDAFDYIEFSAAPAHLVVIP
jgi:hypothetical protein